MSQAADILALTRDARFAPYAMSAIPAWLFAQNGRRVLWANASGAAALDAPSVAALTERTFTADEPLGADIVRLAETLPPTSTKYERLRDIGSSLVCACLGVEGVGVPAIVVIASEAGRTLPLAERASRLFGAAQEPVAVFSPDGTLLYTNSGLDGGTTPAAARQKSAGGAATRCCSRCWRMRASKPARSRQPSIRISPKLRQKSSHSQTATPPRRPRPTVRCALSGPWMRTSVPSLRRNPSHRRWAHAPRMHWESRGASSAPSLASLRRATSRALSRRTQPSG